MALSLDGVLQQRAADLEPHDAGAATTAPGEAAAAVAAARAGGGLVLEQHGPQRVDGPSVVARPLQLGEFIPHRVDEPTWRVISLDGAMFVSAFGETGEGHTSPMYRLTGSPHGALHRGFRRFVEELRGTGRQVVGDGGG